MKRKKRPRPSRLSKLEVDLEEPDLLAGLLEGHPDDGEAEEDHEQSTNEIVPRERRPRLEDLDAPEATHDAGADGDKARRDAEVVQALGKASHAVGAGHFLAIKNANDESPH